MQLFVPNSWKSTCHVTDSSINEAFLQNILRNSELFAIMLIFNKKMVSIISEGYKTEMKNCSLKKKTLPKNRGF